MQLLTERPFSLDFDGKKIGFKCSSDVILKNRKLVVSSAEAEKFSSSALDKHRERIKERPTLKKDVSKVKEYEQPELDFGNKIEDSVKIILNDLTGILNG